MITVNASEVPRLLVPGRPAGVTAVIALQALIGAGDVAIGVALLSIALRAGVGSGGPLDTALFLVDFFAIGLGVLSIVVAYGLWDGKRWAWRLGAAVAAAGVALGALVIALSLAGGSGVLDSLVSGHRQPLVPVAVYSAVLALLARRSVRAFFGRAGGAK